jgi:uncharacterized protein YrrD
MSLRNGAQLGETTGFVINPGNLKIEAFICQINNSKKPLYLLNQDVRDMSGGQILINDYEVLSEANDLLRLKDLIELNFIVIGKMVVTKNDQKLGRVKEFSVDNLSLYIQKIYIAQPIYKSLYGGQLIIDRNQIVEVTNTQIIVKDVLQPTKLKTVIRAAGSITGVV